MLKRYNVFSKTALKYRVLGVREVSGHRFALKKLLLLTYPCQSTNVGRSFKNVILKTRIVLLRTQKQNHAIFDIETNCPMPSLRRRACLQGAYTRYYLALNTYNAGQTSHCSCNILLWLIDTVHRISCTADCDPCSRAKQKLFYETFFFVRLVRYLADDYPEKQGST